MMSTTYRVSVYRTYFLEDEIVDGDYYSAPHTHTDSDHYVGTASDLARWIRADGLRFDATNAGWAADPDGSYVSNYVTGERCETSAHLPDDMPARLASALRCVVDA